MTYPPHLPPSELEAIHELESPGISHVVDGLICQAEQRPGPVDAFVFCDLAANLLKTEIDVLKFRVPTFTDRHHQVLKPIAMKNKGENVELIRV